MSTNRKHVQRLSIEGSTMTLADLHWLYRATEHWDPKSRVVITHDSGDQREPSYSSITVVGDEQVPE